MIAGSGSAPAPRVLRIVLQKSKDLTHSFEEPQTLHPDFRFGHVLCGEADIPYRFLKLLPRKQANGICHTGIVNLGWHKNKLATKMKYLVRVQKIRLFVLTAGSQRRHVPA